MKDLPNKKDAIVGCILGTAVGDALGLAVEGLTKNRQAKMYPDLDNYHFLAGRGMISDDTEHTCMVAQSLIVSAGNADLFLKDLAWRLRLWFLGLPAGIGLATLRSILKLWIGIPAQKSGVYSAGNGPAMRSAIIGVCCGENGSRMLPLVRACTRITHTDYKAEEASVVVSLAAYLAASAGKEISPDDFRDFLIKSIPVISSDLSDLIDKVIASVQKGDSTEAFAAQSGLTRGVTGYIFDTVPVAIHAWLRNQSDYRRGVLEIIRCGGDTDTAAAIVGAIIGARVGKTGIPEEWLDGLCEWPRSTSWMEQLGGRLFEVQKDWQSQPALSISLTAILLRNLFFMAVVLIHGFRRLLPPY
jgi:ADP-ribosyl-[dinitrogen reductase] hydrolase